MKTFVTTPFCALLYLGVTALVPAAAADPFPDRPIRLVVPYAPTGSSDVLARMLGDELREALGQSIVVENRPGAGSMLGTAAVARSPADGYTILLADMPHTIVPAVQDKKVPYDPVKDFSPISLIGVAPLLLFVHPGIEPKTLGDFLAAARQAPESITIGSGGIGASTHLMAALLQAKAGIRLTHVPYKGAGPALSDTVAGQVQSTFTTLATAGTHLKDARLRALAVTSQERLPEHPAIPTFAEGGVSDMVVQHWWGILAPAGVPQPIIDKLNQAIAQALASTDLQARFAAAGVSAPSATGPEALGRLIEADLKRWNAVVRDAGITVE